MDDFFGKEIKVGDIVLKANFSSFTLHKVLGITKSNSIIISIQREEIKNRRRWEPLTRIISARKLSDLQNHNSKKYVRKDETRNLIVLDR